MLKGGIDCGIGLVVLKLIKQLDLLSRDLYGSRVVRGPFESSPPRAFLSQSDTDFL